MSDHEGQDAGKAETPLQQSQKKLTQHSMLSHLDEVLFDLDASGQRLYIRSLHLQLLLLRGHNGLESSKFPLGTKEERVKNFRKVKLHCKLLLHLSLTHTHDGGSKTFMRGSPRVSCRQEYCHRLQHKLTLLSLSFFAISSSSSLALARSFSSSAVDAAIARTV